MKRREEKGEILKSSSGKQRAGLLELVLLILVLSLVLAGCGKEESTESSEADALAESVEIVEEVDPLAEFDGITSLDLGEEDEAVLADLYKYRHLAELDLTGMSISDVTPLFVCESLEKLDIRGTQITSEQFDSLKENLPECCIRWDIRIGASYYDSEAEKLSLPGFRSDYIALLKYFTKLEEVDMMGGEKRSYADLKRLQERYPDVQFKCSFDLSGLGYPEIELDSDTESLDLSYMEVTSLDILRTYLNVMPNLAELVMLDCGPTNEEMAQLREDYPNTKVVWMLHLGYHELRTDIISFSTMSSEYESRPINSEQCEVFKYCTDIMALDLGHQDLTDISFLYYMPNLRVLILADNEITDMTPIGSLTELRYLEIFMNYYITDFEPLTHCQKLEDLNLSYVYTPEDYESLYQLPNLQRLWMIGCYLSWSRTLEILDNIPEGCKFQYGSNEYGSTGAGWRTSPKQEAQYLGFKNNYLDPMFE